MVSRIMQVFCSFLIASAVNAHPGHGDGLLLDQSSALEAANSKIEDLVEEGKLESFWLKRAEIKAQLVRVSGRRNWAVSYVDSERHQRLEMIFSMTGNFVSFSKTAT